MTLGIDGSMSFSFAAGQANADIDATLERLLELPGQLAADRGRRVALVLDEFQEIIRIDPGLLALMRAVFREQPDIRAGFVHSRRAIDEEAITRMLEITHRNPHGTQERAPRAQRMLREALARSPGNPALGAAYRREHSLPGPSTVQKALAALGEDELVTPMSAGYRIAEPFLAEWILRRGL